MKAVAERLRSLREGTKLSQEKFAPLVGMKQSSIDRYERGQSNPSFETLLKYAEYFDVSLDYIFGRTDKPQGKIYECKMENENPEMQKFVEMCFDPKSPMSDRLKQTLLNMLGDEKKK